MNEVNPRGQLILYIYRWLIRTISKSSIFKRRILNKVTTEKIFTQITITLLSIQGKLKSTISQTMLTRVLNMFSLNFPIFHTKLAVTSITCNHKTYNKITNNSTLKSLNRVSSNLNINSSSYIHQLKPTKYNTRVTITS